jgi:hypothetical protein
MHPAQGKHDRGQAATTKYQETELAKKYGEVNSDTLSTYTPPTPTTIAQT